MISNYSFHLWVGAEEERAWVDEFAAKHRVKHTWESSPLDKPGATKKLLLVDPDSIMRIGDLNAMLRQFLQRFRPDYEVVWNTVFHGTPMICTVSANSIDIQTVSTSDNTKYGK
jgi:hypothetical protein